ncbi:glutathione peroxidase [Atopostipes suicloacalis DSM 15692]|uniref:Glutathione peroxidase n=1 Tax=Atopostipes suicloacalis DSM 15692 TaxID=1121025 RepID=A0A1M4WSM6_9LACT|nr:glutathione peroxidase [Atopostipes suicloacalis]SHE84229.1 glutathione peroxidase [Atopostipes suicloacalis DSM 15692]
MEIYNIEVTLENGESYTLDQYKGKTMLIVNTATKCGLATQFEALQELYDKFKDHDFVLLGFPSNQFKQEVDSADEAAAACRSEYGVTFPMHEIVAVNGDEAHPLFKLLTEETKGVFGKAIKWNFTKFLVDKRGNIITRFAPTTTPLSFQDEIQAIL